MAQDNDPGRMDRYVDGRVSSFLEVVLNQREEPSQNASPLLDSTHTSMNQASRFMDTTTPSSHHFAAGNFVQRTPILHEGATFESELSGTANELIPNTPNKVSDAVAQNETEAVVALTTFASASNCLPSSQIEDRVLNSLQDPRWFSANAHVSSHLVDVRYYETGSTIPRNEFHQPLYLNTWNHQDVPGFSPNTFQANSVPTVESNVNEMGTLSQTSHAGNLETGAPHNFMPSYPPVYPTFNGATHVGGISTAGPSSGFYPGGVIRYPTPIFPGQSYNESESGLPQSDNACGSSNGKTGNRPLLLTRESHDIPRITDEMTAAEKLTIRKERNRLSARKSRERANERERVLDKAAYYSRREGERLVSKTSDAQNMCIRAIAELNKKPPSNETAEAIRKFQEVLQKIENAKSRCEWTFRPTDTPLCPLKYNPRQDE